VLYGSESKAINHGTHGIHGKKHKIVMSRWLFVTGLLPCGPCDRVNGDRVSCETREKSDEFLLVSATIRSI